MIVPFDKGQPSAGQTAAPDPQPSEAQLLMALPLLCLQARPALIRIPQRVAEQSGSGGVRRYLPPTWIVVPPLLFALRPNAPSRCLELPRRCPIRKASESPPGSATSYQSLHGLVGPLARTRRLCPPPEIQMANHPKSTRPAALDQRPTHPRLNRHPCRTTNLAAGLMMGCSRPNEAVVSVQRSKSPRTRDPNLADLLMVSRSRKANQSRFLAEV